RGEVVRAAHDAARTARRHVGGVHALDLGGVVLRADVDQAPVDRLAVLLRLGGHRDHATHDEGPSHGGAVDRLLLQADAHEVGGEPLGREALGQLDVVAQPVDGGVGHQISVPNWAEKRTSPSTMSCMSAIPWRSMSVRSLPMPNAKPEYSSGSTPTERSTLGLTIPQPPHSIQPGPPFFCGNHRSISALGS